MAYRAAGGLDDRGRAPHPSFTRDGLRPSGPWTTGDTPKAALGRCCAKTAGLGKRNGKNAAAGQTARTSIRLRRAPTDMNALTHAVAFRARGRGIAEALALGTVEVRGTVATLH